MVPEIVYGVEASGAEWVTVVASDRAELPEQSLGVRTLARGTRRPSKRCGAGCRPGPALLHPLASWPEPVVIARRLSDASFEAMVAEALAAIGSGDVAKVVLARQVDVRDGRGHRRGRPAPTVAPARAELLGLLDAHPRRSAGRGQPRAAGRAGRRPCPQPAPGRDHRPVATSPDGVLPRELLASAKDSAEHRLVVEAIGEALRPLCDELDVPAAPTWSTCTPSPIWAPRSPAPWPRGRTGRCPPPWSWWPPSIPRRRWAGCPVTGPWPSSPGSSPSPGATTPGRSATSTPEVTAAGCWGSGP